MGEWKGAGWGLAMEFLWSIDLEIRGKGYFMHHINLRNTSAIEWWQLTKSAFVWWRLTKCTLSVLGLTWWQMAALLWLWSLNAPRSSPSTTLCGFRGMSFMWWIRSSWRKKRTTFPAVTSVALWGRVPSSSPHLCPPSSDLLLKTAPSSPRHRYSVAARRILAWKRFYPQGAKEYFFNSCRILVRSYFWNVCYVW